MTNIMETKFTNRILREPNRKILTEFGGTPRAVTIEDDPANVVDGGTPITADMLNGVLEQLNSIGQVKTARSRDISSAGSGSMTFPAEIVAIKIGLKTWRLQITGSATSTFTSNSSLSLSKDKISQALGISGGFSDGVQGPVGTFINIDAQSGAVPNIFGDNKGLVMWEMPDGRSLGFGRIYNNNGDFGAGAASVYLRDPYFYLIDIVLKTN